MTSLTRELSALAGAAFAAEGLDAELGRVQPADRPDLAQFQCNGALAAAKAAKANPRAIAEKIAARLRENPVFSKVEIAGPGFLNFDIADDVLTARLRAAKDETPSLGKTLVIDFGGPNVAKPMHVGHLRSAIIGDCLQRLFRANGWHVVSDVHLGDWGLQMGQLISEIGRRGVAPIYFDANFNGPYPEQSPVTMDDLEEIYPAAAAACKTNPAYLEEARAATAELQAGRPGYRALWQHFVDVSEKGLTREYDSLGVHFDLWKGEASVDLLVAPMIDDLKARGLAEESEGALVVRVAEETDKKEMPPLILLKSDGAVLYGTTDLATIVDRVREQNPDLILYVVDQRQHIHFEQVFRAARKAGLDGHAELEHAGFGTMNGADGKPFKTRAGGVMKLYDLIAMVTDEAKKRLAEQGIGADYSETERADIARQGWPRHAQIRRSLEPPADRLHFRSRAFLAFRRQNRALSAICRRAHSIDPAQGGGRGPRILCARRAFAGGTRARAAPARNARCVRGHGGQTRAESVVRLCVQPGAGIQPFLFRASYPFGNRRGFAQQPPRTLQGYARFTIEKPQYPGDRSSRAHVNKLAPRAAFR